MRCLYETRSSESGCVRGGGGGGQATRGSCAKHARTAKKWGINSTRKWGFNSRRTSLASPTLHFHPRPFPDVAVSSAIDAIDNFGKAAATRGFSKAKGKRGVVQTLHSPGDLEPGRSGINPCVKDGNANATAVAGGAGASEGGCLGRMHEREEVREVRRSCRPGGG